MKIAIIGSRGITAIDVSQYISECDELVSGGAAGVDSCAAAYAQKRGSKQLYFSPATKNTAALRQL
jgi:predicted Rossmann fold nucleotide-binding protein DprA/Smf involved in DNA uptake